MDIKSAKGWFKKKVYIGDLFPDLEKIEEMEVEEKLVYLESITKENWIDMREPNQSEKKILLKHASVNEKFFEGRSAKDLQELVESNSKGSVNMIESLNTLMGKCLLSTSMEDDGKEVSSKDLVDFVMSTNAVYERCLDAFTDSMTLKKKKEKI